MKPNKKTALKKNIKKRYRAKGLVMGKYWGGGSGGFASQKYSNPKLKALMKEMNKDFSTGAIDSGMGYEEVTGALMDVDTITTMDVKGKPFTNVETKRIKLGKFKKGDKQFLEENMWNL